MRLGVLARAPGFGDPCLLFFCMMSVERGLELDASDGTDGLSLQQYCHGAPEGFGAKAGPAAARAGAANPGADQFTGHAAFTAGSSFATARFSVCTRAATGSVPGSQHGALSLGEFALWPLLVPGSRRTRGIRSKQTTALHSKQVQWKK